MNRLSAVFLSLLLFALAIPGWAGTIIIDENDPACKLSGIWAGNLRNNPEGKMFGAPGCVNGNHHYTSIHGKYRKTGKEKATWTPNLPQAGKYKVEITFAATDNRSRKVAYEVVHSGGRERKIVNQMKPGKLTLGVFSFAAGRAGSVEMVSDGGGSASVDSAQFTFVGEGGSSGDSGTTGTTGLGDLLGGVSGDTTGSDALIHLTASNPGEKQVTLSNGGKLEAKLCLRTWGPASLRVSVNGTPWIVWTRASDSDSTPCEANGEKVADSIFMENPGDPSPREVTLTLDAKSGDRIEASLEGQDFREENTFLTVKQTSKAGTASDTTNVVSDTTKVARNTANVASGTASVAGVQK